MAKIDASLSSCYITEYQDLPGLYYPVSGILKQTLEYWKLFLTSWGFPQKNSSVNKIVRAVWLGGGFNPIARVYQWIHRKPWLLDICPGNRLVTSTPTYFQASKSNIKFKTISPISKYTIHEVGKVTQSNVLTEGNPKLGSQTMSLKPMTVWS